MAGFSYHKISDQVAVQSLNQVFGDRLNLTPKTAAGTCLQLGGKVGQSSNEMYEFSTTETINYNGSSNGLPSSPSPITNHDKKKSKKALEIDRVITEINQGVKVLVLMRGLPGSGKSTLAKSILENTVGYNQDIAEKLILSTDDFFMRNGFYDYDSRKIQEAHGWNHQRAFRAMVKGYSPLIIDNTNSQMWEMKPYAVMATDHGYILQILEPDTHWCFNEKELEKRNKHGVPKSTIKNMIDRYQKNVTPLKLLSAYDLTYQLQKPPQYRLYPPIGQVCRSDINRESGNFMHFYEASKPSGATKNISGIVAAAASTSVDDILMQSNEASSLKTPVLEPIHTNKMKQSSSLFGGFKAFLQGTSSDSPSKVEDTPGSRGTTLFDNITAWGIDKTALQSWDIVTPLKSSDDDSYLNAITIEDSDEEVIVETREMSTSTEDELFCILRNISNIDCPVGVEIRTTCNRDINRNVAPKMPALVKKLMIHKSCSTDEFLDDHYVHLENLCRVFPNMTPRTVRFWFDKCNRDFDCTLELLLAEKEEVINVIIDEDPVEVATVDPMAESIVVDSDGASSESDPPLSPQTAKNKRKNNNSSEECDNLKKCIERKINISDEHYSQHLLRVKQLKYGPSSSKADEEEFGVAQPAAIINQSDLKARSFSPVEMEVDGNKSDSDDLDWEFVAKDSSSDSSSKPEPEEQIETMEVNLGELFVKKLEESFGDPNLTYPKGFLPVIQVPVTLARQLYTFYIESVYQQMDAQNAVMEDLVKEDEEFARKLQESEEEEEPMNAITAEPQMEGTSAQQEPTEIPQIMREQRELSKHQKEVEKWRQETPDTLAAKLTRIKLCKAFPTVEEKVLVEILHAHDNVYKDTVETLLASTGGENVRGDIDNLKHPPLSEGDITEMWEAHKICTNTEQHDEARSAVDYREEAKKHLEKRTKLYEKAQQYYQNGMKEVAQYYRGLAVAQTRQYENANSLAATAFLDEHSKRLEDFNTIDLHFLYVKEAIPNLDIFLDRIISLLRDSTTKHTEFCQIITGRGKNSANGVSKLRPAVIARLKERKISYNHQNPGLLKIKVTRHSKVTNEL